MQEASSQTSLLFDEPSLVSPDRMLALDKREVLGIVSQLKDQECMPALRRAIIGVQQQLRNVDVEADLLSQDETPDAFVTMGQQYLIQALQQVAESRTVERARYYLDRLAKSVTEVRTSAVNDLNLNRWKEYEDIYTDSLWVLDRRDNSGVHTAGYWGNFVPQIPYQMIKRYTKAGEWVLDAFVGCGTTLIESQRLGRNGIGIELQEGIASKSRELIAQEPNSHHVVAEVTTGDCTTVDFRAILARHGRGSVQLLVMHPPYFDIIKFSNDPRDLSNAESVDAFLELMNRAVDNAASVLDRERYFALVIGDKYSKGEWIPLGFLAMSEITKRGFALKSIIVKNFDDTTAKRSQKDLWRYRALVGGFYIFKHEYIFLFRKK